MAKQGPVSQAQGRTGRGVKTARQDAAGSLSADDIRQQVNTMLMQMEKTIDAEYQNKFSMVVKGMEERISRTAQAQFDAVTKNIESANAAMEQVQQYHQSALAELRSTRQEMERGADPRAEYKAAVESILGGVEEQVGQLRKRFKLT